MSCCIHLQYAARARAVQNKVVANVLIAADLTPSTGSSPERDRAQAFRDMESSLVGALKAQLQQMEVRLYVHTYVHEMECV